MPPWIDTYQLFSATGSGSTAMSAAETGAAIKNAAAAIAAAPESRLVRTILLSPLRNLLTGFDFSNFPPNESILFGGFLPLAGPMLHK